MIRSYRNRPVRIDAIQWDGSRRCEEEITRWARPHVRGSASGQHLTLRTARGSERAHPGDWVVKRESGRFGLVTAEVFSETYEVTPE